MTLSSQPTPPSVMSPSRIAPWFCAALSWASSASAQSTPWTLSWEAPPLCPTEQSVRAQIASLIGDTDLAEPVHITARITPTSAHAWRASLTTETRGAPGTRTLDAASCPELADAVAVILAWMIDPSMRARTAPPAPVVGPPVAAPTPPVAPPPTPPAPPPAETSRVSTSDAQTPPTRASQPRSWRVRVALGARADLGPLPSFAVGPAARVSIVRGRWRVFVHGSWRPSQRFEHTVSPSTGGDFDLWTAGAGACLRWPARPVTPTLCAGLEAGAITGAGFGVTRPSTDRQPWIAASAGAGIELPVASWLAFTARASALVPLVRPRFVIENVGEVFQPAPVGLLTEIDAEVIF